MTNFTEKPPFTKEDWPARYAKELGYNYTLLHGYMIAVRLSNAALTKIAEADDDSQKIKTALLAFIEGQRDLLGDIHEKWYGEDHDQYGLPELHGPE